MTSTHSFYTYFDCELLSVKCIVIMFLTHRRLKVLKKTELLSALSALYLIGLSQLLTGINLPRIISTTPEPVALGKYDRFVLVKVQVI